MGPLTLGQITLHDNIPVKLLSMKKIIAMRRENNVFGGGAQ